MSKETGFVEECYRLLQQVPRGRVTTYAELARALDSRAWRAVGTAMARNRNLVTIPCHRVVRSNGDIGEYALGSPAKCGLLAAEGVRVRNGRVENLEQVIYRFAV